MTASWWLENPLDAPDSYYKSCRWCLPECQAACTDPVCRGRGYGEIHGEGCPGRPPGHLDACTCKRGAR